MDFQPILKVDTHLHLSIESRPKVSTYLEMLPHLDALGIEKGIVLSEERIRICLESALASFRGAFEES